MFNFKNDYSEGCHPQILEALTRTNFESTVGYGMDPYCAGAAQRIREAVRCPEADVHFLVGGTQTNQTAIAAFLRPHQCVIAAATGRVEADVDTVRLLAMTATARAIACAARKDA